MICYILYANILMTELWDCSWSVANVSAFLSAAAGDTELIYTDISPEKTSEKKKQVRHSMKLLYSAKQHNNLSACGLLASIIELVMLQPITQGHYELQKKAF